MSFDLNMRVLIVDDMAVMRKVLKKNLTKMGFSKFEEADDGIPAWEALEKSVAENNNFGLIVCDWNMPGMTGIELLKKIRADGRFKTMPFLMVTAEGEQDNVMIAIKAGVSNFVIKPFTGEVLEGKIKKIFAKKAA